MVVGEDGQEVSPADRGRVGACRGAGSRRSAPDDAAVGSLAWHRATRRPERTPAASKSPDALGLFDLFGNAAEWVTSEAGALVVRGGSFRDGVDGVGPAARAIQDDTWNERDPQLPKSRWWLSDGPFVGFRVVQTSSKPMSVRSDKVRLELHYERTPHKAALLRFQSRAESTAFQAEFFQRSENTTMTDQSPASISRRTFIQTTAAASAAFVLPSGGYAAA